ncbi:Stemmadenine O-acetyltransferase [Linum grandiflorum]
MASIFQKRLNGIIQATTAVRKFASAAISDSNREIQVSVISAENVKPSASLTNPQPFKLNLLDQLMPSTYVPLISFYPLQKPNKTVSAHLKSSLSDTLNLFYPLSGRLQDDNLVIHDFHNGVPFIDAEIKGLTLSNFLQPPNLQSLDRLLPVQPPLCLHPVRNGPQLAVQVSTFECGGVAVGMSFNHRIMDGGTISLFLETWAAISNKVAALHPPDLVRGCSVFRARESIPSEIRTFGENLYFKDSRGVSSRRFVFDNDAVSELKSRARSAKVENPTRREAISAFIWKSVMDSDSESPGQYYFIQAVNLRSLMGQRLSKQSIGNLVATPIVSCSDCSPEIKDLVAIIREGVAGVDHSYLETISGERGLESMIEGQKWLAGSVSSRQLLSSSSWSGLGFNDFDFGLGNPVWTGVAGDVGGTDLKNTTIPNSTAN